MPATAPAGAAGGRAPAGRPRRAPGPRGRAGPRRGSSPPTAAPSGPAPRASRRRTAADQRARPRRRGDDGRRPRGRGSTTATSTPTRTRQGGVAAVRVPSRARGHRPRAAGGHDLRQAEHDPGRGDQRQHGQPATASGTRSGAQSVHAGSVRPAAAWRRVEGSCGADRDLGRWRGRFQVHPRGPGGVPGGEDHDRRQHRRRHHPPRAADLPRPGHDDVHPRRRVRPRTGLGPGRRVLAGVDELRGVRAPSPPGSGSATAIWPPIWSGPGCSPPACRCRRSPPRCAPAGWARSPA